MKRKFSEVIDLAKCKEVCPEVVKECEFCEGIIIDHDNVPQEYIVNYDDRQIHSELRTCEICGSIMCEQCSTLIEDTWDVFYLCPVCSKKYVKQIKKIESLQEKEQALLEKIEAAIYNLRHINNSKTIKKPRRLNGRKKIRKSTK